MKLSSSGSGSQSVFASMNFLRISSSSIQNCFDSGFACIAHFSLPRWQAIAWIVSPFQAASFPLMKFYNSWRANIYVKGGFFTDPASADLIQVKGGLLQGTTEFLYLKVIESPFDAIPGRRGEYTH